MALKSKPKSSNFKELLSKSGQHPATPPALIPSSARRVKPGYIQVGANIPKEMKRAVFKAIQDEDGMNFSMLVERLLGEWLKGRR